MGCCRSRLERHSGKTGAEVGDGGTEDVISGGVLEDEVLSGVGKYGEIEEGEGVVSSLVGVVGDSVECGSSEGECSCKSVEVVCRSKFEREM